MTTGTRRKRRVQTVALAADHALHVERPDLLTLRDADGRVRVAVHVTAAGPVLRFEGDALTVQAAGDLRREAERVAIHGRRDVTIRSDGDAAVEVAGELETYAEVQHHTATLGNVNIRANDDVRLNGERVRMNC